MAGTPMKLLDFRALSCLPGFIIIKIKSIKISGFCWPTKQDIEDRKEYESVAFPYTIQQMMETAAQKRREEQQKIEQREKEIEAKFVKLEQWKKELNDKIEKKARDAQAAKV